VLDDPHRRLLPRRGRPRPAVADPLRRLDEVLRDLEDALQARPAALQSPR